MFILEDLEYIEMYQEDNFKMLRPGKRKSPVQLASYRVWIRTREAAACARLPSSSAHSSAGATQTDGFLCFLDHSI